VCGEQLPTSGDSILNDHPEHYNQMAAAIQKREVGLQIGYWILLKLPL